MLIVVTIIALLSGIVFPVLASSEDSAFDARRAADLRQVQKALETYKAGNGAYPTTGGSWFGDSPANGAYSYTGPGGYIPGLAPGYLVTLPRDPDKEYPDALFGYMYRSDGFDYKFVLDGTPDSHRTYNQFEDPVRPGVAWMVSTDAAKNW